MFCRGKNDSAEQSLSKDVSDRHDLDNAVRRLTCCYFTLLLPSRIVRSLEHCTKKSRTANRREKILPNAQNSLLRLDFIALTEIISRKASDKHALDRGRNERKNCVLSIKLSLQLDFRLEEWRWAGADLERTFPLPLLLPLPFPLWALVCLPLPLWPLPPWALACLPLPLPPESAPDKTKREMPRTSTGEGICDNRFNSTLN